MSRRPTRPSAWIGLATAVALALASHTALAKPESDELLGEWALQGDEDGRATRATLIVTRAGDGDGYTLTRRSFRGADPEARVLVGKGQRRRGALEVTFDASVGLAGRLSGRATPPGAEAKYELAGAALAGVVRGEPSAHGFAVARERGEKTAGSRGDRRIVEGPYVQDAGRDSAVIVWRTSKKGPSVVEWGETPELGRRAGDARAEDERHRVRLEGLKPGRACFYRVVEDGVPQTAIESFRTASPPGSELRFLALGDTGTGNKHQHRIARGLVAEAARSDFVVHLGDFLYESKDWAERFFAPYGPALRSRCLFAVKGNHESKKEWADLFTTPANGPAGESASYSFTWGDAKVVVVDTSSQEAPDGPVAKWLRNELASSVSRWLILVTHVPLYSTRGEDDADVTAVQRGLGPIVEEARVDLVLAGHKHRYERSRPIRKLSADASWPGTVHVTSGGGGADPSEPGSSPFFVKAAAKHHFIAVTVKTGAIEVRAIDEDGGTLDEVAIKKR